MPLPVFPCWALPATLPWMLSAAAAKPPCSELNKFLRRESETTRIHPLGTKSPIDRFGHVLVLPLRAGPTPTCGSTTALPLLASALSAYCWLRCVSRWGIQHRVRGWLDFCFRREVKVEVIVTARNVMHPGTTLVRRPLTVHYSGKSRHRRRRASHFSSRFRCPPLHHRVFILG